MGIFNFKKRDTSSDTSIVDNVLLEAILKGEEIDREKALTLPAVSGDVDFISSMIASMPIKLYKYKQGVVTEIENDSRTSLLNGDTGDTLDAFQMKKRLVQDYLLGKGGYCYIERNRNDVVSLRYVKDIFVSYLYNYKPIFKDYTILVEEQEYQRFDFIKLLRNTENGAWGKGVCDEVGKALETAYDTLCYQLGLVKTGGNKRGFLKSTRKLDQKEIDTLKTAWANLYANNTENVVILNNGLEFQEASNSSVEMQLNENKKTLQDEINNIFHIYPNDFYRTFKEAIYPIVKAFETELNLTLLLEKEKKNMFFEFDVKEIVRANPREEAETLKLYKEIGVKTINEMRKQLNLDYIEGLDVVNVGLGAVLYDTNTHQYYTPNTDSTANITDVPEDNTEDTTDDNIQKVIEDKTIDSEFEQDGNSSEG